MNRNTTLPLVAAALLGTAANSMAVAPVDMTAIGTEIAGYIPDAATAGLAIFGAIVGLRIVVKGFKAVMSA